MAETFQLEVATPERLFVDEQVNEAELPGKDGYLGVLPGHAPLLGALGAGVLSYKSGGGQRFVAIAGGFIEVFDNHVSVLADHAEFGEDIAADTARRELEQAQEALKAAHGDTDKTQTALDAVERAQARVDAAEKASGGAHLS